MAHRTNTSRPKLTVLLPVLNPHPDYFRQAVTSVLGQTLSDFELLVVEDPSASEAAPILAEYGDGRVRHIRNPQRTGLVQQLNQGLAEARGEVVVRMDADDVAEPDRFRKQYDMLSCQPDVAVVGSQLRIIDEKNQPGGYRAYPTTHAAILAAFPRYNPLAHPSVMFRRAAVVDAGGYQTHMHNEDYDLWSRLAVDGRHFANHPEALLRYRVHPGAVKATRLRMMIRGTLEVKDRYWRDKMTPAARLRRLCERGLLWLPPGVVMELFKRSAFRSELPAETAGSSGESPGSDLP